MNIAINTRFLLPNKMEGFGWYTYEITKRIVINHPEHTFYFFFDRKYDKQFIFSKNVIPIVLNPPARHPILFYFWFEFSVAKALKKHKIDLFFSPDGYLSLRSKIPQIAVIHDINFEHYPNDIPKFASKYLRCFFPKFARKATKIITVSNYSKQDICKTYNIDTNKVVAIWNAASDLYRPVNESEKVLVKNKYSNGNSYFLFVGSLHPRKNIQRLLEAYQFFLQKYPNSYDLVIVGDVLWKNVKENFKIENSLKANIHFSGHLKLEDLVKVTASATCLTYIPYFEGFGIPLVEAMKCGVPIISGNLTSLPEVVGDAALLVNPFSSVEVFEAMEKIYKEENLRENLKQFSLDRSQLFSWDSSAKKVWEVLEHYLK